MSPLWRLPQPLLLASASPTRRQLLEGAGLPVETRASGVDERAVEAAARVGGADPAGVARALADAKALGVSAAFPGRLVVGADQVLDCGGRLLHKPGSPEEAGEQLAGLAGRTHALHSAVALARDSIVVERVLESAHLTMRQLGANAIALYVDLAGEKVLGSVGAYQLEGLGAHLFERVEGEHTTVLGLPLLPLLAALRRQGALAL